MRGLFIPDEVWNSMPLEGKILQFILKCQRSNIEDPSAMSVLRDELRLLAADLDPPTSETPECKSNSRPPYS